MCGIVGLFIKNPALEARLGELISAMLVEMSERGPDSAGIAVYRNPAGQEARQARPVQPRGRLRLGASRAASSSELGEQVALEVRASHAILVVHESLTRSAIGCASSHPDLRLMSAGSTIEIFKEKGLPRDVVRRFAAR